jgi:hypothetical protein
MSLKLGRIIEKYGASGDRDTAEVEFVLADFVVTDGKSMKRRVRILAKCWAEPQRLFLFVPQSLRPRFCASDVK